MTMNDGSDVTVRLGAYVAGASAQWSAEAMAGTRRAFVDTMACMLAGSGDPSVAAVNASFAAWTAEGTASVAGGGRLPPPWAALVNGTAAHALDYDDVLEVAQAHVSAVLVPALLALGEDRDATGAALLDAFIVGFEVMARLGRAVNNDHYLRGWHTTLSLGAPAAAAACARLLRLDARRAAAAIAASVSFSGGPKCQFGTMMKPIHAGMAAQAGILAAAWAEAGVTAADEAFAGLWRFADLFHAPQPAPFDDALRGLGGEPAIETNGIWTKPYPCCASTHRAYDALRAVLDVYPVDADQVSDLEALVSEVARRNLMYERPRDAMQGRFSMNHVLALGLVDRKLSISSFTPEAIAREDIRSVWPRIRVTLHPDLAMGNPHIEDRASVKLTVTDGRVLEATVTAPYGHPTRPIGDDDLAAKFIDCAGFAMPPQEAENACRTVFALPDIGARALCNLLRKPNRGE